MALVKCPECGHDVSTSASACPNCGYPFENKSLKKQVQYEQKVVKIRCWGRGKESVDEGLQPYISEGWEVVSMTEDKWLGGILSPVYIVALKRKRQKDNTKIENMTYEELVNGEHVVPCPKCGYQIFDDDKVCPNCGHKIER